MSLLDSLLPSGLYSGDRYKKILSGYSYDPPEQFEHSKDELVATIRADEGSDGQDVEIYECRLPAVFWKMRVLPTPNSVGEMQEGFMMTTGSGVDMGVLIFEIAQEIADGMLGLYKEDNDGELA